MLSLGFSRRLDTALNTLRKNLDQYTNEQLAGDESVLATLERLVAASKGLRALEDSTGEHFEI